MDSSFKECNFMRLRKHVFVSFVDSEDVATLLPRRCAPWFFSNAPSVAMKNLPQEANSTWRLILSSIFYGLSTIFSAMFGLGSKCFLPLIQKQRRQLCRKKLRKIKHDRKTTRKKQLIFNNVVLKLMSQVDFSILNDNSMIIQHWEQSSKKHKKIKLLIVGCYFSHFLDQRRSPFTLITTRQIIRHHKTLINHWPSYFTDATADTMKRFFTENVFF